jgi:predicted HAD superfamily Cof-like phosphohydrolase
MKTYLKRLWQAVCNSKDDPEFEDVRAFQEKFGQLSFYEPGFLSPRKLAERGRFLQEELNELLEAKTLEDQADALVDLVYVSKGTAVMMGLPWRALWDDVQRANMAKARGLTHRGNKVDVMKPVGWVPPQGAKILEDAGWTLGPLPYTELRPFTLRDDDENRVKDDTAK